MDIDIERWRDRERGKDGWRGGEMDGEGGRDGWMDR